MIGFEAWMAIAVLCVSIIGSATGVVWKLSAGNSELKAIRDGQDKLWDKVACVEAAINVIPLLHERVDEHKRQLLALEEAKGVKHRVDRHSDVIKELSHVQNQHGTRLAVLESKRAE